MNPPRFGTVLGVSGGLLIATTVAVALVGTDPYAASLLRAGFALLVGGGLLAAGVRARTTGHDHRSWRSAGWLATLFAVASLELFWSEVVAVVFGDSTLAFSMLTTVAIGVGAGAVVAWYDRRSRLRDAERAERHRSYREVFDKVEDAIVVHDPETGEILDANSSAERVYGYPPEQLTEMAVGDFSATDEGYTQQLAVEKINLAAEEGSTTFEWVNVQQDGERVRLEVNLRAAEIDGVQRVLAVVRDITERKEREQELRVKDRALDAAEIGITITDADSDQELVYVNDAFLETTGYNEDEVLGRNCRFLQGEATTADPVDELRRAVEHAESATVELLNYRADGSPFWNRVTLSPIHDGDGVTHFVGFQQDVTEKVRREQLFSVMNRILRHNLRNDMTIVGGHAELLVDELDEPHEDVAATIADTARELTAMGEKARELESAVTSEADRRPRDVTALVERVADDLREAHPDGTVTVDATGPALASAVDGIGRALAELGENALEHGGGAVEFRVEADDELVTVDVCDDGTGLPEMERTVLESGRETPLDHGQGIGLPLVNWLVTQGRGSLEVTVDDGTTISIELEADPSRESPVRAE